MPSREQALRSLPAIDQVLRQPDVQALLPEYGHALLTQAARQAVDQARQDILAGQPCPSLAQVVAQTVQTFKLLSRPSLTPLINATGVVIHTNLGRAPLCADALAAMAAVGGGYSNLEYDLQAGERGSRYVHAEDLLCRLCGAEAALVVNNNAAAVLLALSVLARGREAIISRGQLVEIGGGFRIPDVMKQSGARLVEVGTTNRTHLRDYQQAIGPDTGLIMLAHQSNFRITGFTAQVSAAELVALGRAHGLPVYKDLGSGTLMPTERYGLVHEPTIQEVMAAGVDLVSCSGDKLLGGPQAGILLGRKDIIARLRDFPLTRALRVDKTTLAGLQATLLHYIKGDVEQAIPIWRMIAAPLDELEHRARRWAAAWQADGLSVRVLEGRSAVGGGSLPGETLPTWLVGIAGPPDALAARLRAGHPPVIARIENDLVCLDLRTVLPEQETDLLTAVRVAAR